MRWFGPWKVLACLPVRDKEESHCQPVTQSGNVERGRTDAVERASITAANGTTASSVMFQRRRAGNGETPKRLDPGGNCQDERKPDLDPL